MSYVISIYGDRFYKKTLLPAINNADSQIVLYKDEFALEEDIAIAMEVVDFLWSFKSSDQYRIYKKKDEFYSNPIKNEDVLMFEAQNIRLTFIVSELQAPFYVYTKVSLENQKRITIGKKLSNHICYDYLGRVSKEHAVIDLREDGCTLYDTSSNGVYVNGKRINRACSLAFGDEINILELQLVYLGKILAIGSRTDAVKIDAQVLKELTSSDLEKIALSAGDFEERAGDAAVRTFFHRTPRNIEKIDCEPIEIDEPPAPAQQRRQSVIRTIGPSFTMAIPMLLGCLISVYAARTSGSSSVYMYTGLVTAGTSALIGGMWATLNMRARKRELREDETERQTAYVEYLQKTQSEIRERYDRNTQILRTRYPETRVCVKYGNKTTQLWNRNQKHEDFLYHRLGLGRIPFQAQISVPKEKFKVHKDELALKPRDIQSEFETLKDIPVGLNFLEHTLTGIIGGKGKEGAYQIARNLIIQIAAGNCYTDVKIGIVFDRENGREKELFDCAKWLPHVWSEDRKARYVADTPTAAGDVFYEIAKVLRTRMEDGQSDREEMIPKPYYILIVTDPKFLEGELIAKYVFDGSARCGLSTLLLVEQYEDLPNSCEFIVQNDEAFQGYYLVTDDSSERVPLRFDTVEQADFEAFSRRLSSIEVNEVETGGEIPESLTFFEMMGIHSLDEMDVPGRWRKNRTYDSMRVLIGQKSGGAPCYLDIHEKYHGPHGLVAGTTGSGKSETLQTWMLSLAVNFSPDDIGFFIIDYKGGGMANLFSGLPHVMGQISNLSGNQVRRAMVSIKSENRRRQRVFNEYGVNNINNYTRLYKGGEAAQPVPHLFIIIDEFAELKREEPDFMRELISVAQVGRSLGVHLILATQKPSGTVDDNIWSNTRFRLCLRVQDRQDSNDMLHKPDAAYITQAGRCYLQVGNDEVYELFQSGFSGAAYDEEEGSVRTEIAKMYSLTGKAALIGNRMKNKRKKNAAGGAANAAIQEKTQLDAVVEYLARTAKEYDYTNRFMLWMPVLPELMELRELEGYPDHIFDGKTWKNQEGSWKLEAPIGLLDDPANQAQDVLSVNLSEGGNHAVIGTVVSGKSTFLQTFVYSMVQKYSPDWVNFYLLDFSSNMLGAFEGLAHVGGVIRENELDKCAKFFNMMKDMMEERKETLKGGNYEQYVRAHGVALPAVIIVIDQFSNFAEKTNHMYEDILVQISRNGAGYGIYLVMASAGFGMMDIPNRIGDNVRTTICLELGDKFQYADALHTFQINVMPEGGVKGRGLVRVNETVLEFQTAVSLIADDDYMRAEQIAGECARMNAAWKGRRARPIPVIPEKPVLSEFLALESVERLIADDRHLPVGYNSQNASPYSIDLSRIYCYIVSGKARTGKTNFLKVLLNAAAVKGGKIIVFDFDGALKRTAESLGVRLVGTEQEMYDFWMELLPEIQRRNRMKRNAAEQEFEEEEIYAQMSGEESIYFFIDDLTAFVKKVCQPEDASKNMKAFLENITEKGRLHQMFFFAGLNSDRISEASGQKLFENMVSYKTGIHFGGNVSGQRILDYSYIPFTEQSKVLKPGIGLIPAQNGVVETKSIVVPMAKK